MIPLALCSSNGCPGIWLDEDGSVVVQGDLVYDPNEPTVYYCSAATCPGVSADGEARVRIPADVLRRAVETLARR